MVGRGVSRLEATWTKLEIWGETGDKRPSKWTREPVWVGAEIMWKRGAEGVPEGAGRPHDLLNSFLSLVSRNMKEQRNRAYVE